MMAREMTASSYRVEISGWDVDENFFVEKADLAWDETLGKRIAIHNPVRAGSLLFVRLLDPRDPNRAIPVAYKAATVEPRDVQGQFHISLVKIWPRSCSRSMNA